MMNIENLASVLPNLRNQFSFIGFIVLVVTVILSNLLLPDDYLSMAILGSIGLTIIIFGQIFFFIHKAKLPPEYYVKLIFRIFITFCLFLLAEIGIAAYVILNVDAKPDDGVSINIPNEWTFEQASETIAGDSVIIFIGCNETLREAKVDGGALKGKNRLIVLQNLRHRSQTHVNYKVRHDEDNNRYEIDCS